MDRRVIADKLERLRRCVQRIEQKRLLPLACNAQNEMFLKAYYPDTDPVLYTVSEGNVIAGIRAPRHIRIIAAETLTGRRL